MKSTTSADQSNTEASRFIDALKRILSVKPSEIAGSKDLTKHHARKRKNPPKRT